MINFKTDLFKHQKDAYEKLIKLKVGALYMGMGTGKTRTAMELVAKRFNSSKVNHVLWFCPCSVKTNLRKDIEKHSDNFMDYTTIMGIESISMSDRIYLECLDLVQKYNCFLIVDESDLVKNPNALRTKRMIALAEVCSYKLILTGTPITKNEADLYAQWYILDKRIFGYRTFWSFAANHLEYDDYGKIRKVLNVDYLTNKIAPYSFEISKDQCLDLPEKRHHNYHFGLTEYQMVTYAETLDYLTLHVDEYDETTVYRLLHALQLVVSGREVDTFKKITHTPMFENPLDNPRIELLEYVLRWIEGKIIIWCKYHFEIDEVKCLLQSLNLKYAEMHGNIPLSKREEMKDEFENNPEVNILIGNKKSGGRGLNLQFCNNMIFYSNDFDWGATAQGEDRIHRPGQSEQCNYYYLWSDRGIDEMIQENQKRKANLDETIRNLLNKKNFKELLQ